jgi:hypothetical protein
MARTAADLVAISDEQLELMPWLGATRLDRVRDVVASLAQRRVSPRVRSPGVRRAPSRRRGERARASQRAQRGAAAPEDVCRRPGHLALRTAGRWKSTPCLSTCVAPRTTAALPVTARGGRAAVDGQWTNLQLALMAGVGSTLLARSHPVSRSFRDAPQQVAEKPLRCRLVRHAAACAR